MKFKTDEEALSWLKSQPDWGYTLSADEAEVWAGEYDAAVDETLIGACEMLADAMKPKTRKVSHKELMEWANCNGVILMPLSDTWIARLNNGEKLWDKQGNSVEGPTPWKALIAARKVLGR